MAKYIIATTGEIPLLGNISGPITTPIELSIADVVKLLNAGVSLYQTNPLDKNDKVKVTFDNYTTITFKRKRAAITNDRLLNRAMREMEEPIVPKYKDGKEKVKEEVKKENKQQQNTNNNQKKDNKQENKKDKQKEDKKLNSGSDFEK